MDKNRKKMKEKMEELNENNNKNLEILKEEFKENSKKMEELNENNNNKLEICWTRCLRTVSYTHLDVYKRQAAVLP